MPTLISRDVDRLYALVPVRTCMCRERIRDSPSPEEANGKDVLRHSNVAPRTRSATNGIIAFATLSFVSRCHVDRVQP